jgi:glyoxylase-like metal-dependent hydrolase (beta-lactamase superfamily II)
VPQPRAIAAGLWLIPGGMPPGRQPDGNSVIIDAPDGLVVVDTGRHRWHREAILALARARGKPIAAIVNTHWHLDHVSGNPDLEVAYPALRVHASTAIDGALAGFLAKSAEDSERYLDDPQVPESMREDIRADRLTIAHGAALRPDVPIERSGVTSIGGRDIRIHLVTDAVTAGDVWLYDESSRIAILGDLVTLPAPFLDTACPAGWTEALRDVGDVPFELAIPGHGAPLTHAQFDHYRNACVDFVACAATDRAAQECGSQWAEAVEPLLEDSATDQSRAQRLAEYYVGMLRAGGGRSPHCQAPAVSRPAPDSTPAARATAQPKDSSPVETHRG